MQGVAQVFEEDRLAAVSYDPLAICKVPGYIQMKGRRSVSAKVNLVASYSPPLCKCMGVQIGSLWMWIGIQKYLLQFRIVQEQCHFFLGHVGGTLGY
jgi:hypothetical protein